MIARYISSEDGNISLKAEVKDLIKEKNDWIQVVEENGKFSITLIHLVTYQHLIRKHLYSRIYRIT